MYLISIVIIVYYFSQWKAALAVTSSGIGIGTTYGLSGILIPELQAEANPNLRVNLQQGSYVGEEPFYSYSDRFSFLSNAQSVMDWSYPLNNL